MTMWIYARDYASVNFNYANDIYDNQIMPVRIYANQIMPVSIYANQIMPEELCQCEFMPVRIYASQIMSVWIMCVASYARCL